MPYEYHILPDGPIFYGRLYMVPILKICAIIIGRIYMNLFIIIPAYNEERAIGRVIKSIPKSVKGVDEINVLVVDDGSTDKTVKIASSLGADVFSHHSNRGVGGAFISGIELSLQNGADLVVTIDADGQFNPNLIPDLIRPIIENKADFVTCSRFKDPDLIPEMPRIKIWGNKQMARFISLLTKNKFYDVSCGFRAYSREAILHLNLFGKFTYTQESFLDLVYKGMRVTEVPLPVRGQREFGDSKVAKNVVSYGFKSMKIILRTIRDYKPLTFFGLLGLFLLLFGTALEGFLLIHWFKVGSLSPYKAIGFIGAFFGALGFIVIVLALVADMLDRIRLNQEKLLYYQKKREHESRKDSIHNRN